MHRLLIGAVVGLGAARVVSGAVAWATVRSQLLAERIVVPPGPSPFAGRRVSGPLGAFAQAEAIRRVTAEVTGGRAYGEIPEGDPVAETAMDGALLRASLFTSVLAFGVAAAEVATGAALLAVGATLARLSSARGRLKA